MRKTCFSLAVIGVTLLVFSAGMAHSDSLEQIYADGTVRVATNPGIEPMEYWHESRLIGYDIDFAEALAESLGVKVEWVIFEHLEDLTGALTGEATEADFDIIISAMGIDEKRTQHFIAVPYFQSGLTILTSTRNDTINSLATLADKRVAAVLGSTEHAILSRMPNINTVEVRNYNECVQLVVTGEADAAVLDVPVALIAAKRDPNVLRVIESPFEVEWYGVYMGRSEKKLFRRIRQAVQQMRRDGTLEQLNARWF